MDKKKAEKIDKLFLKALNDNVFPGAAFSFSRWEGTDYTRYVKHYGCAELKPEKKELTKDHIFDLASLTKPLATVPVLLALFEKNIIQPQTRLAELFSICPPDKKEITIKNLMSHRAGFIAHKEYFTELVKIPEKDRKELLLKKIFKEKLLAEPGNNSYYSDIGFMLLGLIIEKITAKNLSELASEWIFTPSGLQNDLFFPGLSEKGGNLYVSTEKCLWSSEMLCGTVHDDNCRAMAGVAGHAGLFGTIQGVGSFCEQLLDQWQGRGQHPAYSNNMLKKILTRVDNSTWTMGFDMVSKKESSSGHYFSEETVGHLGFTGTSFWIDPVKNCIAVLLSNRVHPSRENLKIKKFRPIFHDLLLENN